MNQFRELQVKSNWHKIKIFLHGKCPIGSCIALRFICYEHRIGDTIDVHWELEIFAARNGSRTQIAQNRLYSLCEGGGWVILRTKFLI
ncbi:MAG: hypothetical protein CMJ72_02465 [Planctomycetaceae bacterium]|nr:hypothetical protein [Planctomycetaceae bacterium]